MDQSLILERRPATLAWFFLAISLSLVAAGLVFQQPNFFIAVITPLILAIIQFMTRPAATTLHFGVDSISDEHQEQIIRYDDILGLTIAGRTPVQRSGKIRSGCLVITGRDRNYEFKELRRDVARQVYNELIQRIPETGSRQVASTLKSRLSADLNLFESDLVFSYRGRRGYPASHRDINWFCIGLILGGIAWAIVGAILQNEWLVCGFCTCFLAVILQVAIRISWRGRHAIVRHPELASLIVSPRGIAMVQDSLIGELKWSEMKSLNCERAPAGSFLGAHPMRAITIGVAGAHVMIHDIYDRPLATIFHCMNRFWETPG